MIGHVLHGLTFAVLRPRLRQDQREIGRPRAGEAMSEAESSLGEGNADSAVDSQGRALDALRKGAQGLAGLWYLVTKAAKSF